MVTKILPKKSGQRKKALREKNEQLTWYKLVLKVRISTACLKCLLKANLPTNKPLPLKVSPPISSVERVCCISKIHVIESVLSRIHSKITAHVSNLSFLLYALCLQILHSSRRVKRYPSLKLQHFL